MAMPPAPQYSSTASVTSRSRKLDKAAKTVARYLALTPGPGMESAIPAHLRCPRTRHRRVPDDYAPPYPSFVARHAPAVERVAMAYFGVQFGTDAGAGNLISGPNLIFQVLPALFQSMGAAGVVVSIVFFFLMTIGGQGAMSLLFGAGAAISTVWR